MSTEISGSSTTWTAAEQATALRSGQITSVALLDAHLAEIERWNPAINAFVTLATHQAMDQAERADADFADGIDKGPLQGIPVGIKDTEDTEGILTTLGSPIFRDNIPNRDHIVVERLKLVGAVLVGKTNVPELATGSHTVNELFGATANPYAVDRSAGGSSGGSAAALASRMVPLATGSDMGGSLRNPASFCNVIGLRTSAGRVPAWPSDDIWQDSIVNGPMARTAADAAQMLAVIAGKDNRIPISLPGDGSEFSFPLDSDLSGIRIGWSQNLSDLEVDPRVTQVLEQSGRNGLIELGAQLHRAEPELGLIDDAFRVIRGFDFFHGFGPFLEQHPDLIGDRVRSNIEFGRTVTAQQYGAARRDRTLVYRQFHEYFEQFDVMACPAAQVPPFPIREPYVREINGVQQPDYLEWMKVAWRITLTGFVALSVPCGFTPEGLPIGMQLVAPPHQEQLLLQVAHEFEKRRPVGQVAPTLPA